MSNQEEMAARLKELDRRARRIIALEAQNRRLLRALETAEHTMDAINGRWGADDRLCCFCRATEYNAEVGIEHLPDCAIISIRKALNPEA